MSEPSNQHKQAEEILAENWTELRDQGLSALDRLCSLHPDLAPMLRHQYEVTLEAERLIETLRDQPDVHSPKKENLHEVPTVSKKDFPASQVLNLLFTPGAGPSLLEENPSSQPPAFPPGTLLAERYRIVMFLGRGGMGEVYRADDLELGHSVALKFLLNEPGQRPLGLEKFRKEVTLAREISHRNVCRVFDIGQVDEIPFLSMEYIDGETLGALLGRINRFPRESAIETALQLSSGLAAVHDQGVLHLDLKPSNVMIDGRGRIRLTDFGIAEFKDNSENRLSNLGTPLYMAPEHLDQGKASIQSDIYSLGIVLFKIYTGRLPYDITSKEDITTLPLPRLLELKNLPPQQLSSIVPDIDISVEQVIMQCLEIDPARRPPSAHHVAAEIGHTRPLKDRLRHGDTPSPTFVASLPPLKHIKPKLAYTVFAGIILSLLLNAILSTSTQRYAHESDLKKPAIMEERALALSKYLFGNSTQSTEVRDSQYLYTTGSGPSSDTKSSSSSRFQFVSRTTPSDSYDPQEDEITKLYAPGSSIIILDTEKKLIEACRLPLPGEAISHSNQNSNEPWKGDIPDLFLGWNLNLSEKAKIEAQLTPLPPNDPLKNMETNRSTLRDSTRLSRGETVDVARINGQLQHLRISSEGQERPLSSIQEQKPWQYGFLQFLALIGACHIGWSNLRKRKSDRSGAFRLAFFIFCLGTLARILGAHHSSDILAEFRIVWEIIQSQIFHAFFIWILYIALEPLARRAWPEALISWNRLLSNRQSDPLVATDALVGTLTGCIGGVMCLGSFAIHSWITKTPVDATLIELSILNGTQETVAHLLLTLESAVEKGLMLLFLLLTGRLLLKHSLPAVGFFVVIALSVIGFSEWWPHWIYAVPFVIMLALVTMKFGLVALITARLVTFLAVEFPFCLTQDWRASLSGYSALLILGFAAICLFRSIGHLPFWQRGRI